MLVGGLGLWVREVRGRHDSNVGLLVCGVCDGGAGCGAGVLAGDVVMSVNGGEVGSAEQLRATLESSKGSLMMRVLRQGRRHLTLVANVQR